MKITLNFIFFMRFSAGAFIFFMRMWVGIDCTTNLTCLTSACGTTKNNDLTLHSMSWDVKCGLLALRRFHSDSNVECKLGSHLPPLLGGGKQCSMKQNSLLLQRRLSHLWHCQLSCWNHFRSWFPGTLLSDLPTEGFVTRIFMRLTAAIFMTMHNKPNMF